MKENRGLSLVELLITIAILAIVLAAATSFMITGSRSFAKGNADSELQKEAELAVNQVLDMIIDVNGGMDVPPEDPTEVTMYHAEVVGGSTVVTGELVQWNQDEQKLYYAKWNPSYDEDTGTDTARPAIADQPLADNVAAFEVELDTTDETALDGSIKTIVRSVQIRVGYENSAGRVDYATSPIITLRNRMLLSGDMAEIFEDFEAPEDTMKLWYSGIETGGIIPIINMSSEVQRNGVYTIYARLNRGEEIQGGDVSHLVNWELETVTNYSSIDSSGILQVGKYEPNDYLTITAKYKNNPSKKATGIVKVVGGDDTLKKLTGVHIRERMRNLTTASDPFNPLFGSNVDVEGPWTTAEIAAIDYKWEVIGGDEYVDYVDGYPRQGDDGSPVKYSTWDVKIKKEEASYNQVITIKLTATAIVEGQEQSVWTTYPYTINPAGGDSNMKRGLGAPDEWGNRGHGTINYTYDIPLDSWPTLRVTKYEYYLCDERGNKQEEDNAKYGSSIIIDPTDLQTLDSNHFYYTLTFDENLPLDRGFYVRVHLEVEQDQMQNNLVIGTSRETYDRIHFIPPVSMYDRHEYAYFNNGRLEFHYGLLAYGENQWAKSAASVVTYTIEDMLYDVPEGVEGGLTVNWQPVSTGTICRDVERIKGEVELSYDLKEWVRDVNSEAYYNPWSAIKMKYVRFKVALTEHPEIYTYIDMYFD